MHVIDDITVHERVPRRGVEGPPTTLKYGVRSVDSSCSASLHGYDTHYNVLTGAESGAREREGVHPPAAPSIRK